MILMDQIDEGTWVIKTGEFIPDTERWLHQADHMEKLNSALDWVQKNKPVDNFGELTKGIVDETKTDRD
jgi:hypothetical protein